MENASKALLMAGGILIALLIIGALVLMFNNLSNYQKVGQINTKEAQIIEFNNQYETYNRKNVRGSDLYSLLNRVVDYNRRKSTEGTGANDQGQYLAYEPMTITFSLVSSKGGIKLFSPDEENRLLKKEGYTQSSITNDFEKDIAKKIEALETQYGAKSLTNLTTGLSKIFIEDTNDEAEQQKAIRSFNDASNKVSITKWNEIKKGSTIREDIYTYYEYVQFKRARFDCTKTEYNQQTGRIIKMEFQFTGKFE